MTSLTEVYEGGNGAGLRRLYAGVALFGVGAVLLVAGIVVAATEVQQALGLGTFEAREVAGVLGGVGLPAVLVGTMTVLPRADRLVRLGAAVGATVCLGGVFLFQRFYPTDWVGGSGDTSMTLVVAAVYFVGAILTSWCLFASVASFKARNDPGGTVKLEVTKGGETRIVEVSNENLRTRLGGVGLLGSTPDGDVETQTNRPERAGGTDRSTSSGGGSSRRTGGGSSRRPGEWPSAQAGGRSSADGRSSSGGRSSSSGEAGGARTRTRGDGAGDGFGSGPGVTDGGSAADLLTASTDDAEFLEQPSTPSAPGTTSEPAAPSRTANPSEPAASPGSSSGPAPSGSASSVDSSTPADSASPSEGSSAFGGPYCGNCAHFQYTRTDDGIAPYCGFRGHAMDDMDACDQWTPKD